MAVNAAAQKKALAAPSKSEGMRMLFDQGATVAEVKEIFGVPYGFAYGVAVRNGTVVTTPRAAKAPKAKATAKAPARTAKAPAKAAPRAAAKTSARRPAGKAKAKA